MTPHKNSVWAGEVQVFAVEHPKAGRVYAWSHESGPGGKRRFHAVLGAGPVTGAVEAVRVAIVVAAPRRALESRRDLALLDTRCRSH